MSQADSIANSEPPRYLCDHCHDLNLEQYTQNASAESPTSPGDGLIFEVAVVVQKWLKSMQKGCRSCQTIWDVIAFFNPELALMLTEKSSQHASVTNIILDGWRGLPLMLVLEDLPPEMHFPNVEIYTRSGTVTSWDVIGHGSKVEKSLDTTHCLSLMNKWVENCRQNHPTCTPKLPGRLPTRVLQLKPERSQISVPLHVSDTGQVGDYIALSYCWRGFEDLKTTTTNVENRKAGIPWGDLPRTFRDTITIAERLGVEYVWIDSLCIIQDDKADWEREASLMAHVYENALVTIATDSAKIPKHGIFVPRSVEREQSSNSDIKKGTARERCNEIAMFSVHDKNQTPVQIYAREMLPHFELINTVGTWDVTYPLLSRAWTLQERLLSTRILHVTAYELIWECRTTLLCECGSINREFCGDDWRGPKIAHDRVMGELLKRDILPLKQSGMLPRSKMLLSTWTRIVHGYSSRRLTDISDRLPAISGVAAKFADISTISGQQTYLAGLWAEDLPWLLCWRVSISRYDDRQPIYCGPTWSWVSVSSPIMWDTATFDASSKVEIIGANTAGAGTGQNKLGGVRAGYITLRGPVKSATVDFQSPHPAVLGLLNTRGQKIYFVPDLNPPDMDSQSRYTGTLSGQQSGAVNALQTTAPYLFPGEKVSCLWLLHKEAGDMVYGLVLASPSSTAESLQRVRGITSWPHMLSVYPLERVGVITEMSWQYAEGDVSAHTWFAESRIDSITSV